MDNHIIILSIKLFQNVKIEKKNVKTEKKKNKSINNYTIKPDIMFMDINFGSYEVFGL